MFLFLIDNSYFGLQVHVLWLYFPPYLFSMIGQLSCAVLHPATEAADFLSHWAEHSSGFSNDTNVLTAAFLGMGTYCFIIESSL